MKRLIALVGLGVAASLTPPALAEDAAALFGDTCAACHQAGGIGQPGLAPPLRHAELFGALGERAPGYIAGIVTGGFYGTLKAQGETYVGLVMPPQELSDADLAALGTYVLQVLNGLSTAVTPEQIAAARATPPGHQALKALRAEVLP